MLIAPTEPAALRKVGKVSSTPEKFGVDILFATNQGIAGIQRKEIKDFVASVHDGRLGKELIQMEQLAWSALILEGRIQWTNSGQLMSGRIDWSKNRHISSLMEVQNRGIHFFASDSLYDTIEQIQRIEQWFKKSDHNNFASRPKPKGTWGRATSKDWLAHLYQSFEGIGYTTAKMMAEYSPPLLRWTISLQDLMNLPGIGPKRARALIASLETTEISNGESGTLATEDTGSQLSDDFEIDPTLEGV